MFGALQTCITELRLEKTKSNAARLVFLFVRSLSYAQHTDGGCHCQMRATARVSAYEHIYVMRFLAYAEISDDSY